MKIKTEENFQGKYEAMNEMASVWEVFKHKTSFLPSFEEILRLENHRGLESQSLGVCRRQGYSNGEKTKAYAYKIMKEKLPFHYYRNYTETIGWC